RLGRTGAGQGRLRGGWDRGGGQGAAPWWQRTATGQRRPQLAHERVGWLVLDSTAAGVATGQVLVDCRQLRRRQLAQAVLRQLLGGRVRCSGVRHGALLGLLPVAERSADGSVRQCSLQKESAPLG